MKPDLIQIGFVILVLVVMFIVLKYAFFKPLGQVMDTREAEIRSGSTSKAEAAARVEKAQEDYTLRLRDLRNQAADRRKALADDAHRAKDTLLDAAHQEALTQRTQARQALESQRAQARTQLEADIETLTQSMVHQLMKQA